ncbi:hypothetical protein OSCT_0324 [Oscillochloris trichoides DG-6]|uniref:Uncharacterized protein n=1 Tax=Oscillochloris trichoides DG-6 TaxID=765420 RepID=E1IAH3_9CHLR|nr:hypothetical protein OSCT_0324 [Oscillochloris trichoides DG-6]
MFQSAGRIWGFWNPSRAIFLNGTTDRFNPPGGFGAFGTGMAVEDEETTTKFQSAGRIWGFWNQKNVVCAQWKDKVSIRRADLGLLEQRGHRRVGVSDLGGFNPPGGFGAFGTSPDPMSMARTVVSIRRADLGLLERSRDSRSCVPWDTFQSAGRIWGFWNGVSSGLRNSALYQFQSAGRIWGFWNHRGMQGYRPSSWFQSAGRIWGFWNPQGTPCELPFQEFQSAGRIWGFWNHEPPHEIDIVQPRARPVAVIHERMMFQSAGRIWGFWNILTSRSSASIAPKFQSAGRIWGFWNMLSCRTRSRSDGVSIRRADLGLLERRLARASESASKVSIRRADLGLLERVGAALSATDT